jgi:hypothetical protein
MISKMNYLLLSAIMVTAIDSTLVKCCPCWKDKTKLEKDKTKLEKEKTKLSNDNKEKENVSNLINNKIEIKEIISINDNYLNTFDEPIIENNLSNNTNNSQPLNEEEIKNKVDKIINEALKNGKLCNDCIGNEATENKITVIYDVIEDSKVSGKFKPMTKEVGFGFCPNHKKCDGHSSCKNDSVFLTFCGHRLCPIHTQATAWSKCPGCNECNCNYTYIENFGKHIWCNVPNNRHYVCFNNNLENSPFGKKDYDQYIWVCPEHQAK